MDDLVLTALHSSAFAITTDAVIALDDTQRIVLFNSGAEKTFGYEAADIIGLPLEVLLPVRFRNRHEKLVSDFARSGETVRPMGQRMTIVSLHRDGHEFLSQAAIARVQVKDKVVLTAVIRDITQQVRQKERVQTVLRELDHRVKNVLARLSALVQLSGENASSAAEYRETLLSRLDSITRAHAQLSRADWRGVQLHDLILDQTSAYAEEGNLTLQGPEITLVPEAAQSLSMIVHELVTNAAKHGALSPSRLGHVAVSWTIQSQADLLLIWKETSALQMSPPGEEGLGTSLIKQLASHEIGGSAEIKYLATGISYRFLLPLARLVDNA